MALVTANGVAVVSGMVLRPLVGIWFADLILDQVEDSGFTPGTKVTLKADGGYELHGVVDPNRAGHFLDAMHVRVIGGAGGMSKPSSPRSFVQPGAYVRDVLNSLCQDAGETLSSTIAPAFLGQNLTAWSVFGANSVRRNIRALLDIVAPDMSLRMLSDGKLWIGDETWPASSATFDVMNRDPNDGSYLLGVESPFVEPGSSLPGVGNVGQVMDTIDSGRLRTRVWVDFPNEERGTSAATQTIAQQALAGVDYYATYLCEVVAQATDLASVDVRPIGSRNEARLGGLQRVPVRVGTGAKIQFTLGSTVLLGWDGGNPEGPYVCCGFSGDRAIKWVANADQVEFASTSMAISATGELKIDGQPIKLNGGTKFVARVGDKTVGHVHTLTGNAGPFPIVGTAMVITDSIAEGNGTVLA